MPKDRSSSSKATRDVRCHPYKLHSRGSDAIKAEKSSEKKEWEDAVCPICLESPHNAVLLLCTSHDKGCRPFMCNTSYRHSNCLDQYRKSQANSKRLDMRRPEAEQHLPESTSSSRLLELSVGDANSVPGSHRSSRRAIMIRSHPLDSIARSTDMDEFTTVQLSGAEPAFTSRRSRRQTPTSSAGLHRPHPGLEPDVAPVSQETNLIEHVIDASPSKRADVKDLVCPLCRGKVTSWLVIDAARKYLNAKSRSCSQEACLFSGNYEDLRSHARCEHPLARPSEADPERQRDWRRMERQRDMGDVLSSIRSAMPGATLFGDYAIEDDIEIESEAINLLGEEGSWWRVLFLFQVFGPTGSGSRERSMPSRLRGHQHRQRRLGMGPGRLRQWMDSNQGTTEEDNTVGSNNDVNHVADTATRRPRNPRRHWGDMS